MCDRRHKLTKLTKHLGLLLNFWDEGRAREIKLLGDVPFWTFGRKRMQELQELLRLVLKMRMLCDIKSVLNIFLVQRLERNAKILENKFDDNNVLREIF